MPHVPTAAMALALDRFGPTLAADEHAVMVLDGAGWHAFRGLRVPSGVSRVPPPRSSPQLDLVVRVRLQLRERHLPHGLLPDHDTLR